MTASLSDLFAICHHISLSVNEVNDLLSYSAKRGLSANVVSGLLYGTWTAFSTSVITSSVVMLFASAS